MRTFTDRNGRLVRLTDERVSHIALKHPEVNEMLDDIGSVLAGPDIVTPDLALEVYRFYRWFDVTPKGPKYLVVMAKMTATDAWVLTAWLTDRVR